MSNKTVFTGDGYSYTQYPVIIPSHKHDDVVHGDGHPTVPVAASLVESAIDEVERRLWMSSLRY